MSAIKKPLTAMDCIEIPDFIEGSERHSENLFSRAQLAKTDWTTFASTNKINPPRAIHTPCASMASAWSFMPEIFSSKEATVRL